MNKAEILKLTEKLYALIMLSGAEGNEIKC